MRRPTVLLTNDDGIGALFLRTLAAAAAQEGFEVWVAAPTGERSWIGRAFSRNRNVPAAAIDGLGDLAWSLDGTPSDCVNIALGHLLPRRPDVVLSGMNIGYNASMPLCLSSGTLAGAIEGAAWGIPAAACSLDLSPEVFEQVRHAKETCPPELEPHLRAACAHAVAFARTLVGAETPGLTVHNLNYPSDTTSRTPVERTVPAHLRFGALFARDTHGFTFRWNDGAELSGRTDTDVAAIERGSISHTVIDFSRLGS
ncbi:MAG: 5'/3'-nucleotidase SurE [Opitutia bacterium]|jgi:5'-nucleotidase